MKHRLDETKSTKLKTILLQKLKNEKKKSKKLNKCNVTFDYFDKSLIVLSATSGRISIIPFASLISAPAGIASENFCLIFSLITGILKKLFKITRNRKNKYNKIAN